MIARTSALAGAAAWLVLSAAPLSAQTPMDQSHVEAPPHHAGAKQEVASEAAEAPGAEQDDQPGNAPPPPIPTDNMEDIYYDAARMRAARADMAHMGNFTTSAVLIDELEYQARNGRDGYRWQGQAWYGNDHDRLAFTTEGESEIGRKPERIETSLLWRHALDPYFNLEAGVRHDFRPHTERTYAVVGIEGLAPYWFEVEGQLLLSNKGEVRSRLMASYEQRITQALILEPEAELSLSFQDIPEIHVGSGVESLELGARLRYELKPGVGPYVGVHWERKIGDTARFERQDDDDPSSLSFVLGLRAWF